MYRIIVITVIFWTVSTVTQAQSDLKQILTHVQQRYQNADTYRMKVRMDVFNAEGAVSNSVFGGVYCSNNAYFTDFNGTKSLYNANCLLKVDESSHAIYFKKVATHQKKATAPALVSDQLKMLEAYHAVVRRRAKGGYKITFTDPSQAMFNDVEIWLNADYSLYKVIYHYADAIAYGVSKSEITYYDISFNTEIPKSVFSETQFIRYTSGGVRLNADYNNYTLQDLTGHDPKL